MTPFWNLTSQNCNVWAQTRDNLLASGESVCLHSSDAGYEMHGLCALTPILKATSCRLLNLELKV